MTPPTGLWILCTYDAELNPGNGSCCLGLMEKSVHISLSEDTANKETLSLWPICRIGQILTLTR